MSASAITNKWRCKQTVPAAATAAEKINIALLFTNICCERIYKLEIRSAKRGVYPIYIAKSIMTDTVI